MAVKNKSPRLILVRHAHRDVTHRERDNGLSEKGEKQAIILGKELQRILDSENVCLLSSPKQRCLQTLTPLSKLLKVDLQVKERLIEQQSDESDVQFRKRISEFLKEWRTGKNETTCICTHGDWLPIAMQLLLGTQCEFKKASWAEVIVVNHEPTLRMRPSR